MTTPENDRILSQKATDPDEETDATLRPSKFDDFIGQEKEKYNLSVFLEAAKKRGEALDHILEEASVALLALA